MSDPGKNQPRRDEPGKSYSNESISNGSLSIDGDDSFYSLGNELTEYMGRESMVYQVYPGAEMIDFDFTAERLNLYSTNLVESTAHLVKGCLGAGILNMHVGYMYGGLWTSLAATFLLGPIVFYTMLMLVKSAQTMYVRLRIPRLSYADLAEVAVATGPLKPLRRFSKTFRYTVDTFLFIEMCGTCCMYEIMIAVTIKHAFEAVSPNMKDLNLNERIYILIITVPLAVLCLIRNLKYLAPFSLAAEIYIAICVFTTMYYSTEEGGRIQDRPAWKSFHGLFRFLGVYLFSIDGLGVTLTVENNMRKPKYFSIVLEYGMTIVLICVTITGFFGYWGWGEESKGPITIHMPPTTVPIILQFLLAIMLSVTFAVHLWVPFRIVWHYIGKKYKRKKAMWERIYRIIHFSLITCFSVAFPNMTKLMIFFGNFFVGFIAFIFPALIESLIIWREPHKGIRWKFIKNGFLMLFGVILSGGAFYALLDF